MGSFLHFARASRTLSRPDTAPMTTYLGLFNAEKLTLPAAQATLLVGGKPARPTDARRSLVLLNATNAVLYIGGPTVNDTDGFPITAGNAFPVDGTGGLYAYSVAGGTVNLLEGF